MWIEKSHNKKTGVTYVYSAESYYVPERKRTYSRRTLIGKLDPVTGEIVKTGKPGRPRKNPAPASAETPVPESSLNPNHCGTAQPDASVSEIDELKERISTLEKENARLSGLIGSIEDILRNNH